MVHVLAQLSDPHINEPGRIAFGRVDTALGLKRAVDAVLGLPQSAEAVLVSGDLTDLGRPQDYAHLRELLSPLRCPVYLMVGNHDERDALLRAFSEHEYLRQCNGGEFVQYTVEIAGVRLIALDTVVPREEHGALCERRLAWLETQLALKPQMPTIVAMHHPPFATRLHYMDGIALRTGGDELARIVRANSQVRSVICGHLHRSIQLRWAGTIALTAPSTAHQIALDLRPDEPPRYTLEPPGFLVHAWTDGDEIVTHVAHSGPWEGPFGFDE
jgi:3',5'-cyclic AMP phosphodiesterase CpdA